jgi:hypothetical protein
MDKEGMVSGRWGGHATQTVVIQLVDRSYFQQVAS